MNHAPTKHHEEPAIARVRHLGAQAVETAGEQVGKMAELTEREVKKFPLAAVGIAFGSGVALGAIGKRLQALLTR